MAVAKSARAGKPERPLSPHLQVYRMTVSMLMSILHRITGAALYFGSLLLAWWLVAAASGPAYFELVSRIMGSLPGKLVLVGYTWALIHHAIGGIRHFIWDTGRGYDLRTVDLMSWGTILTSTLLTAALWLSQIGGAASWLVK
jgi:succinate dehydrogenase / fumarate reductase cytochrome b subunit